MRRIKKRYLLLGVVVAIVVADRLLVWLADYTLMQRGADFEGHLERVTLSYEPTTVPFRYGKTECEFKYIFLIYGYQTCFTPRPGSTDPQQQRGYHFVYTPPRPKTALLFRGDGPENYHFTAINASGRFLQFVTEGGEIQEGDGRGK